MHCPNCGTVNEGAVRFCANCGTPLAGPSVPPPIQPQVVPPYSSAAPPQDRNSFLKLLGMGCVVVLAIFVFGGLGCMRACLFGRRRLRFGR